MIELSKKDNVATLVFNRPHKMNAFTHDMWRDLCSKIGELNNDKALRLIILKGSGGNFCAGADIGEFEKVRDNPQHAASYEKANTDAFAAIRNCPIPTIAAIEGNCFGGGFGIAAACDLRFGNDTSKYCVPPAKLGLAYPVDAMQDIVNAIGAQTTKYLAYTANVIDAQEALGHGFILEVFDQQTFDGSISAIAARISNNAPLSNRATKAAVKTVLSGNKDDRELAIQLGNDTFASSDYTEGRAAFSEKRKPVFTGK